MPIFNVPNISLPANITVIRSLEQTVPGYAPSGTYTYYAYGGDYPWNVEFYDSFPFEKLGTDGDGWLGSPSDWPCEGDFFSGESVITGLPETSVLYAPYPNPFNRETNLTFYLSEAGCTTLIVYDIQGREFTRLFDGFYPGGIYRVNFHASVLSSGVYFACLSTKSGSKVQKLLLIK